MKTGDGQDYEKLWQSPIGQADPMQLSVKPKAKNPLERHLLEYQAFSSDLILLAEGVQNTAGFAAQHIASRHGPEAAKAFSGVLYKPL